MVLVISEVDGVIVVAGVEPRGKKKTNNNESRTCFSEWVGE